MLCVCWWVGKAAGARTCTNAARGFATAEGAGGILVPLGRNPVQGMGSPVGELGVQLGGSWGALGRELFRPYGSTTHTRAHARARTFAGS